MKAPPNTTQVLKAEAKRLIDKIFRYKPCVIHYKQGEFACRQSRYRRKVEKHHLIPKGQSVRFKFNIWNIIPICEDSHRTGEEMAAHPYGSNTEAEEKFWEWLKENLPLHWAWYQEHKDEPPRTLYLADWDGICDELRYYANHSYEAEQIIYEKDSL